MAEATRKEDRVFVRNGRKHYRQTYSLTEVRIGGLILLALGLITVWIIHKGRNPDPALFTASVGLKNRSKPNADRGPLPDGLAREGWREAGLSSFTDDNLYEKINGRADYYRSFGFQQLYFLTLEQVADPSVVVDIELYDLKTPSNALGAYGGERPEKAATAVMKAGLGHLARNALLMTQGRYYVRAIGSDESAPTVETLEHVRTVLSAGLPGEPLPWAYSLFAGTLGYDPGKITFQRENAFSFDFANNVYSVTLPSGGDDSPEAESELFVTVERDDTAATQLAKKFVSGFLDYGTKGDKQSGFEFIKDRYLGTVATASARGPWVIGIRGAKEEASAAKELLRLDDALKTLPDDVVTRARTISGAEAEAEPGPDAEPDPGPEPTAAPTPTPEPGYQEGY